MEVGDASGRARTRSGEGSALRGRGFVGLDILAGLEKRQRKGAHYHSTSMLLSGSGCIMKSRERYTDPSGVT